MSAKKREISLLPQDENLNSLQSLLINWSVTIGRFIIIFTELIVIIAFLSRFYLDRKNADLSEIIRQQRAVLDSVKEFENEYNTIQNRINYIKTFYVNSKSQNYIEKIKTIIDSTPPEIIYTNISLSEDKTKSTASLDLFTLKEEYLINYITNLSANPVIKNVIVNSITKKPKDTKYEVNINLTF